jgi:2-oxo-3-hexenedioate decarboxylase
MDNLSKKQVEVLAKCLEDAELSAYRVSKVTDEYRSMTYDDAYNIQWEIRRRKEKRGSKIVGMRMGSTSVVEMAKMGVQRPCYGFLADYFSKPNGGDIKHDELIEPKVSADLAFVTRVILKGPGVNIGDVLRATDFVMPAVGIIDSRYRDSDLDIMSVIADNSSSSRFVSGGTMARTEGLDLKNLGVVMEVNGQVVRLGAGAAVLGHPASSVVMLANMLAERGEHIPAGSFIMVGAVTEAVSVEKGDYFNVRYQGLGSVSGRFV